MEVFTFVKDNNLVQDTVMELFNSDHFDSNHSDHHSDHSIKMDSVIKPGPLGLVADNPQNHIWIVANTIVQYMLVTLIVSIFIVNLRPIKKYKPSSNLMR